MRRLDARTVAHLVAFPRSGSWVDLPPSRGVCRPHGMSVPVWDRLTTTTFLPRGGQGEPGYLVETTGNPPHRKARLTLFALGELQKWDAQARNKS